MIGNAAMGLMPSRLTRIRQGPYSPMPSDISAPSTKLRDEADPEPRARERDRLATARHESEDREQEEQGGDEQRHAHAELHRASRQARDHLCAHEGTRDRRRDHADQRHRIHDDGGNEDQRLRDGRQRVADVQRARDLLVRHVSRADGRPLSWSRRSRRPACRRSSRRSRARGRMAVACGPPVERAVPALEPPPRQHVSDADHGDADEDCGDQRVGMQAWSFTGSSSRWRLVHRRIRATLRRGRDPVNAGGWSVRAVVRRKRLARRGGTMDNPRRCRVEEAGPWVCGSNEWRVTGCSAG